MSNEIDALFDFASANSWQRNSCMASAAPAAVPAVLPCVICSQIFGTPQRPPTTITKHTDVACCVRAVWEDVGRAINLHKPLGN